MGSKSEAEKAPYTVNEHKASMSRLWEIDGPTPVEIWFHSEEKARQVCDGLNAAFAAGRSAQVEETGPPDIDTFPASIREDMRKHIARYPNLSRKHYLDHAKALLFLTPSSVGEQTGDPAPTVEAIAAEIERWYLGLSDKPHQDGVLMLDRKANGYVLSDEERTRLRSRLTALSASPTTVEPVADPDAHILDQEDYLKAKQERFKGSGWAKDDASPKGQGEGWTDQEIRDGEVLKACEDYADNYPIEGRITVNPGAMRKALTNFLHARDRMKAGESGWIPVELAKRFHEAYERLAPSFGYATREDTRAFDPESANGKLMIAVCAELFPPKYTPSPDTQKP